MKRTVRSIITLLLLVYVAVAVSWSHSRADEMMCRGLHIEVDDSKGSHFVTAREVAHELGNMAKSPSKRRLADINTDSMERLLNNIDKIESAVCTKLTDGTVNIEVTPMQPVARVFEGNHSYYINKDGKRIFLSHSRIFEDEARAEKNAERRAKRASRPAKQEEAPLATPSIEKTTLGDIEALAALKEKLSK